MVSHRIASVNADLCRLEIGDFIVAGDAQANPPSLAALCVERIGSLLFPADSVPILCDVHLSEERRLITPENRRPPSFVQQADADVDAEIEEGVRVDGAIYGPPGYNVLRKTWRSLPEPRLAHIDPDSGARCLTEVRLSLVIPNGGDPSELRDAYMQQTSVNWAWEATKDLPLGPRLKEQ